MSEKAQIQNNENQVRQGDQPVKYHPGVLVADRLALRVGQLEFQLANMQVYADELKGLMDQAQKEIQQLKEENEKLKKENTRLRSATSKKDEKSKGDKK